MSEPVSNAEIEDVLSSIRRLVSNDVQTGQEIESVNESAQTGAGHTGKLILTADFRVSEPQDNHSNETDATDNDIEADDDTWQEDADIEESLDNTPLRFFHTERGTVAEAEAEPAQEDAQEIWQDLAEKTEDSTPDIEAESESEVEAEDSSQSLENTIADLEAAIGKQQGEWEPDGSDFEEDADAEEVLSEPVPDWIGSTAHEVDVEGDNEIMAGVEETKAVADVEGTDLFGGTDSVIDEVALHDMVSDIVRQELQGALGERITRNVRKLVRREINRVLASQDFD